MPRARTAGYADQFVQAGDGVLLRCVQIEDMADILLACQHPSATGVPLLMHALANLDDRRLRKIAQYGAGTRERARGTGQRTWGTGRSGPETGRCGRPPSRNPISTPTPNATLILPLTLVPPEPGPKPTTNPARNNESRPNQRIPPESTNPALNRVFSPQVRRAVEPRPAAACGGSGAGAGDVVECAGPEHPPPDDAGHGGRARRGRDAPLPGHPHPPLAAAASAPPARARRRRHRTRALAGRRMRPGRSPSRPAVGLVAPFSFQDAQDSTPPKARRTLTFQDPPSMNEADGANQGRPAAAVAAKADDVAGRCSPVSRKRDHNPGLVLTRVRASTHACADEPAAVLATLRAQLQERVGTYSPTVLLRLCYELEHWAAMAEVRPQRRRPRKARPRNIYPTRPPPSLPPL